MSITREQLIQYIEKPGLLKEQTIGELKEIIDEFPYFQSAQLLYTCNLFAQANFRYSDYLKTCSIYATDRTVLYRLLQPRNQPEAALKKVNTMEELAIESSALIELSEENQITEAEFPQISSSYPDGSEDSGFDLLSFEHPELTHYKLPETDLLAGREDIIAETGHQDSDKKIDLIEQFIKVNPSIQPRIENVPVQVEPSDLKDDAETEKDEFITETLSRIYLKQGHYQKAIDSFKRLSLKFPEKSVYFAQQIEEIKKLLN
jgi:tetratricopeptide (TPR) repeat protein